MTLRDILASPYSWTLFGICLAAGWYVKRELVGTLAFGSIAPFILVPVWLTVCFCFSLPALIIARVAPDLSAWVLMGFRGLPEPAALILSPPFLATAALFVVFCRSAREGADLRPVYRSTRYAGCANPFRRKIL